MIEEKKELSREKTVTTFVGEQKVREAYRSLTLRLIAKQLHITTMESATSGQIASLITDTEGASAVMKGAFVTYSNEVKILMGVPAEIIETYGVYSEETARAMAEAAAQKLGADLAVGVTGTMGNVDPANGDSVPGRVYFAIYAGEKVISSEKKTIPAGRRMQSYIRELAPMPDRLTYKLAVAWEVAEELDQILQEK